MIVNATHVYAIPGENHIIDVINPETGLSSVFGHTQEQIKERYPQAQRYEWEAWRQEQIQKQNTPIRWTPVTDHEFNEMLEILPPLEWSAKGFLVGEPIDHSYETGQPRFQAYLDRRGTYGRQYRSNRPLTVAEWRKV